MAEAGPPYASSPTDTPRNSTSETLHTPPPPPRPPSDNPFNNPTYTERGTEPEDALMMAASPGSLPPTPKASANSNSSPQRPILQVRGSSYVRHPPPKRLDLPTPTSPPSQPANPMASQQQEAEMDDGGNERRKEWWTEWLCGCREDGDNQVCSRNVPGAQLALMALFRTGGTYKPDGVTCADSFRFHLSIITTDPNSLIALVRICLHQPHHTIILMRIL